jgi:hypothetical protein
MDKRIFAITGIIEKISTAERNESASSGNIGSYPPKKADTIIKVETDGLTTEVFINWLEKNEITNILLGESCHAELLRRSSPLFRFLFRNGRLTLEKIDTIWNLALEKHDTLRKHIIKIVNDIGELMSYSELCHLFEKLKQINMQDIDQDTLQLLKTMGNNISVIRKVKTPKKSAEKPKKVEFDIESETVYKLVEE